jgi:Protein kinase domain
MSSLQNSTVVAGYRIDGSLGEGGMGTVYRATQLSLDRVVALKVLTAELSGDPAFRERFRREGQVQAALDHPHIVTVFEAGQADQGLFLAMQMVEGPTLKDLIVEGELGDRRAMRLLTQVAEALDAAHERGLIHRDVKPQNVLVGRGEHAYLADFGLTRGSSDARMTATGLFVGTIDYISPEQARGESATAGSDVYALTAVLYECLTGQVPFVHPNEERVLFAHLSEDPPRLTESRGDLPTALDEVIARGMAKDPAERPASASELMLEARRALGARPASDDGAAPTQVAAPPGRRTGDRTSPGAVVTQPGGAPPPTSPRGGAAGASRLSSEATAPSTVSGHRGFVLAVVLAALVAAAVGALLGGSGSSSHAAFNDSASTGDVELSFPNSWHRVPAPPSMPALSLTDTIALAPVGAGARAALLAGVTDASGPTLLPAGVLASKAPPPTPVMLGTTAAYRYSNVSVPGFAGPVTVYVVPTTAGVATVVCPAGGDRVARECAQIADTLRLNSATAFPLTPSPAYASALSRTLASLQATVNAGAAGLNGAHSAAEQAAHADQLAGAFDAASLSVAHMSTSSRPRATATRRSPPPLGRKIRPPTRGRRRPSTEREGK